MMIAEILAQQAPVEHREFLIRACRDMRRSHIGFQSALLRQKPPKETRQWFAERMARFQPRAISHDHVR